ncbi:ATP-binding protein [Phocicoccus pinnipedialis]|uniref:HAMP domain-containing sensor histidine kinase n=1 Tax=Phocicoccus pinnipedialis TaxID=110845 RepID=UPI00361DD829
MSYYFKNYALNSTEAQLQKDLSRIESDILINHSNEIDEQLINIEDNLIIYKNGEFISTDSDIDQLIYETIIESENAESRFIITDARKRKYMVNIHDMSSFFDENTALIKYSDLTPTYQSIRDITMIISLSAFFIFLITTIFGFLLIKRITEPLIQLKNGAFNIAKGNYKPLKVKSFDEIGELTLAFNKMNEDIKSSISDLQHEKNLREHIFSSISDGIVFFNRDLYAIYKNAEGERWMREITQDSTLVKKINDEIIDVLYHKSDSSFKYEVNESYLNLGFKNVAYTDVNYGVTLTIRDITNEQRLEMLRHEFISSVSHELKTPMVMLTGYSEALLDGVVTDEDDVREMISIIKDESDRMNTLVNELIIVSKLESGQSLLNIMENDIVELIKDIAQKFRFEFKKNHINFEYKSELNQCLIPFDYDKLNQVFTNLIDNAIRYTEPNDTISIILTENKRQVFIEVKDTGKGIKASSLGRIFERFYKEDKARTRGKQGTGLGLSIVKSIINGHGGDITVDSIIGQGTTFTIVLNKDGTSHETL